MHAYLPTCMHACMHTYIQVLLEREKLYIAGCLTTLMSYKECLAVALQEGALDITVAILRAQDKVLCVFIERDRERETERESTILCILTYSDPPCPR